MRAKLIAHFGTSEPFAPPKDEVKRKILKYLTESRRPRSLQDVSQHVRLPDSEAKGIGTWH